MTEIENLPTTLSYSEDDVSRDVQRKVYVEGWYPLLLESNFKGRASTGSYRFEQTFVPLKDPNDATAKGTVKVRNFLTLPFANPKQPGKEPPNTLGICHSQFKALGGDVGADIPDYPKKADGVMTFLGEEIAKDEIEDARKKVSRATRTRINEIWEEPTKPEGHVMCGYLVIDGGYNKIKSARAELPEGESFVNSEEWFTSV